RALIVDDEPLARSRVRLLLASHRDVEIIAECSSSREAEQVMASETPDLLFLDIEMQDANGFAIAGSLDTGRTPAIVFVTAHEEFALQAFEANAVDYLVKPFSQERFDRALDRVRRFLGDRASSPASSQAFTPAPQHRAPRPRERFAVRVRGQVLFVKTSSLEWIGAEGNYARLHTPDTSFLIRESLQQLESELDPELFVRVHRSAIVNIERVSKLILGPEGAFSIVLQSEAAVSLGPTYRERLEQMLGQKL
ncbi:MAG TPA: LytTR family DNA-binding domain-containing protein, partial [Thermoanaerobaculia bacterium]|nr:LytTR family DNA-binding domain-containing protein [Thermoanaerobaculia bacterium]